MTQQIMIWLVIVCGLALMFAVRAIVHVYHRHGAGHVLTVGRDRDIFYVPGDCPESDDDDE